jgi:GxxExxY protein
MINDPTTHAIIGCAMNVHNKIGTGFQELIYQRALSIELTKKTIEFSREVDMDVYYDDERIGTRRIDFFIENRIVIEIKACKELENVHIVQLLNYLDLFKVKTGLLINFGAPTLEFKRLHNKKMEGIAEKISQ